MSRKLIAILRGIKPAEAKSIAEVLVEAGISRIEVSLNSPEPFDSIEKIAREFGADTMVGAGTVLSTTEVQSVADAGGELIVSPNTDVSVIKATRHLGLHSYPGVMTPSECFAALNAGAHGLKLFPASVMGHGGLKAIRAVLPENTELYMVGGVNNDNLGAWLSAGADGFGIGSSLYKPGFTPKEVAKRAIELINAYDIISNTTQ